MHRTLSPRSLFRSLLAATLVAVSLSTAIATAPPAAAINVWTGPVLSISDGDTFWYENDDEEAEKIRILGIDTNEIGDCWAAGASSRLGELISGETVRLEAQDPNSMSLGRLQRHVFVDQGGEWVNVAEIMLSEGWGLPQKNAVETDYAADYVSAALGAARQNLRIWDDDSCGSGPSQSVELELWVNADADGDDNSNINGEWVDIRNLSGSSISLTGWTMRADGRLGDAAFAFPNGTTIPAGDSIRLHSGTGTDDADSFYWGNAEAWLPNDLGVMFLRDPDQDVRAWRMWPCEGGCGPTGTVVIEEVDYNAPGDDSSNPNGERIRIRNVGPDTVDLGGWKMTGGPHLHLDGIVLSPGEGHEIRAGVGSDTSSVTYWGNATSKLNNSGGALQLITPTLDLSDCYSWGSGSCSDDGTVGGLKLWANYDAAGNDTTNPNGEYVALENVSDDPIDLTGYELVDEPHRYTFGSVTLSPGSMLRVKVGSGSDSSSTKYWGKSSGIFSNGGDHVTLEDPDGNEIMEHHWPCSDCGPDGSLVIDAVNYDAPGNDRTNPNGEWVRIRNAGYQTEDLRGWQLGVGSYQLTSIASRPLDPGETITVYMGAGSNSGHVMHWGKSKGILVNSGGTVVLRSPHRETIDCHGWGSKTCADQSISAGIEITANPDANGTDSSNPNGERINLTNTSSSTIELDGFALYTPGATYEFDGGDDLDPGDRIQIRMGSGTDTSTTRYWGVGSILNNSADYVELVRVSDDDTMVHHAWPCATDPCGPTPDVEITAVVYDAPGNDNENINGEYVRITNQSSSTLQMRDWQLLYKNTIQFNLVASRILDPGESITLYMGDGSGSNHVAYMGYDISRLANSGGSVKLVTPLKDQVDCVDWGNWSC